MPLSFKPLHPTFAAECGPIDLTQVYDDETLAQIRAGMDRYGVLVFHDQPFTDEQQIAFAQRFDGELHAKTGISVLQKSRLGNEALTDISNLDEDGRVMDSADRRRQYSLGNRLWHTDASFQDPPGRYSLLHARVVPPVPADTEFADMYTAYETLDEETKAAVGGLRVAHSIAYSRQTLGFEFSQNEAEALKGAVHPLVRTNPDTGRKSLYLASHAYSIEGWNTPDARLFLNDLREHATQRELVYRHEWRVGDLVIWDNRATMHRGKPFPDTKYKRELRRVTTLDLPRPMLATTPVISSTATR